LDPDAPEKPQSIDRSDRKARAEHLKEIVADARAALSLVERASSTTPAANEATALLSKIVSDDVEEGPPPKGPKKRGRPPKRTKAKRMRGRKKIPIKRRQTKKMLVLGCGEG
jgi:hypothetical protein